MEPIDKLIVRVFLLILGSIFGYTTVQNTQALEQIADASKKITYNAGLVPLPPKPNTTQGKQELR